MFHVKEGKKERPITTRNAHTIGGRALPYERRPLECSATDLLSGFSVVFLRNISPL